MTSKKIIFKENKPTSTEELAVFGRVKHIFKEEERVLNVLQLIIYAMGVMAALLGIAMISVMLASCSIIDEDTSDCPKDSVSAGTRSGSAIAFSVGDSTACTKGTVLSVSSTRTAEGTMTLDGVGGTESLRSWGFGVFACHTGAHPYISTSTKSNLMHNQLVTWDNVNSVWAYEPLVYWPNGTTGDSEFVTFFAYAPHSDNASDCIVDMSRPDEVGDPWILYQLGGTASADGASGWKASQIDLLYDFKKDQQRGATPDVRVSFDFKHALACIGDRITVSCDESVKTRLKGVYTLSDVELTVTRLTFDYQLTRKGRLVLNNSSQPNWQAVESEDTKVHRTLVFTPDLVMARATSRDAATTTDFDSGSGHGIFYIPIESGNTKQQVTVTADYTVTSGDPTEMLDEGSVSTDIDLSFVHNASEGRNMAITLRIPEPECSGTPLNGAALGQIICSHGRAHAATDGALSCGGEKVAVVAYVGDASGEVSPFNHGLAIALQDADAYAWCSQKAETCLEAQAGDLASALATVNGLTTTALLVADDAHLHTAAVAAYNYRFDGAVRSGAHPAGTSRWFLPSMGQWNLMVKAIAGSDTDLSGNQNAAYKATAVSPFFTDCGGDVLRSALYWSSTEKSTSDAWYVSFENGKAQGGDKDETYRVRPVLAF